MHQRKPFGDMIDLYDVDMLDPTLAFTPTTMTRMENVLMNLDGANDDDSDSDCSTSDDSNQEWSSQRSNQVSSSKKLKSTANDRPRQLPGPKSSRRIEDMTREEVSRRQRRRERNKAAAARCRQRRLDITNELLAETQQLEAVGQQLEREIESLRKQRDQLEFVLEAHQPMCQGTDNKIKPEQITQSVMSVNMMPAVRPSSLSIAGSLTPSTLMPYGVFDLGSTGVTPVVSASGLNLFMGAGTDYMSPTTLLGTPTTL